MPKRTQPDAQEEKSPKKDRHEAGFRVIDDKKGVMTHEDGSTQEMPLRTPDWYKTITPEYMNWILDQPGVKVVAGELKGDVKDKPKYSKLKLAIGDKELGNISLLLPNVITRGIRPMSARKTTDANGKVSGPGPELSFVASAQTNDRARFAIYVLDRLTAFLDEQIQALPAVQRYNKDGKLKFFNGVQTHLSDDNKDEEKAGQPLEEPIYRIATNLGKEGKSATFNTVTKQASGLEMINGQKMVKYSVVKPDEEHIHEIYTNGSEVTIQAEWESWNKSSFGVSYKPHSRCNKVKTSDAIHTGDEYETVDEDFTGAGYKIPVIEATPEPAGDEEFEQQAGDA